MSVILRSWLVALGFSLFLPDRAALTVFDIARWQTWLSGLPGSHVQKFGRDWFPDLPLCCSSPESAGIAATDEQRSLQSHIQMCSWQSPKADIPDSVSCLTAGACVYEGSLHQVGAPPLFISPHSCSRNLRRVSVCDVWVFAYVLFTGDITRLAWLTAAAVKGVYVKREVVKSACISGRGCCTSSFVRSRGDVSHL